VLGAGPFAATFGAVRPGDPESLKGVVRAAIRNGWAVVLDAPGTKEPMCTLSTAAIKKADTEAQKEASDAGDRAWQKRRHQCGTYHALTDPAKVSGVIDRVTKQHGAPPNIGLELRRSRLVVVDADTAAEVAGFVQVAREHRTASVIDAPPMTVASPGVQDPKTGEWIHKDGGHWWLSVPEGVELPPSPGVLKHPAGFSVMWADRQVLVPPSVRREGPYRLQGDLSECPEWLGRLIFAQAAQRAEKAQRQLQLVVDGTDPAEHWSARVSWAELLEPDGWHSTGLADRCGCPIWTAPGVHASPKSATAHEPGCDQYRTDTGWGPLHIWTDNAPEELGQEKTLTKVQYLSRTRHGGNDGAAMRAEGISVSQVPQMTDWSPPSALAGASPSTAGALALVPDLEPESAKDVAGELSGRASDEERASWAPVDLGPILSGDFVPMQPTLMPRSDGVCLLYRGLVHSFHGESESGKSMVLQWECARVLRAGGRVSYVDFESNASKVVGRIRLLGAGVPAIAAGLTYRHPEMRPDATVEEWAGWSALLAEASDLVVLDGVTDALVVSGARSKDNDDITQWLRSMPKAIAKATGAAVVLIDHVTKDPASRGRFAVGGQAKMNGLDGAAYVVEPIEILRPGHRGVLAIGVAKDREGEVREHGGDADRNRIQPIAEFVVDSSGDGPSPIVSLNPPSEENAEELQEESLSDRIVGIVELNPGITGRGIREYKLARPENVVKALDDLVITARIRREPGPRNSHMHYVDHGLPDWTPESGS
jgi:hypothetical protein